MELFYLAFAFLVLIFNPSDAQVFDEPLLVFKAFIASNHNYSKDDVIIFDKYVLDEHNWGYNASVGIYTSTRSGIYFFTVFACNQPGKVMHYAIVHGNSVIATSKLDKTENVTCASTEIGIRSAINETVYVKSMSNESYLYSDSMNQYAGYPTEPYFCCTFHANGSFNERSVMAMPDTDTRLDIIIEKLENIEVQLKNTQIKSYP